MRDVTTQAHRCRQRADGYSPRTRGLITRACTRELAKRNTGAVEIALIWHMVTDSLSVSVKDASTGAEFQLVVEAAEAMDVFHHPYAYAASRGVEYWQDRAEMEVFDA